MAKLPGYDSKVTMSTEPSAQMRDMAQEQQMGKNIQSLGKVARDLAIVWQTAEDAEQTLSSQLGMDEGQRIIFDDAAKDPDYKNSEQYHTDLDNVRIHATEGFTNNEAAAKFSITANNQTAAAKIKMDSMFRTKFNDHYKSKVIESRDASKRDYIASGDEAARDKHRGVVAEALRVGAVGEVFVANEAVLVDDWENLRYLQVAETDPDAAIEMVKNSTMDPTQKQAALNAIKSIATQGKIKRAIKTYQSNVIVTEDLEKIIDDPQKSYVEKLDAIEQSEKFGYPEADAKRLKANLDSTHKDNVEPHDEQFALVTEMIGSLQSGFTKDGKFKDALEYMRMVKDTKDYIVDSHTDGRITTKEKNDLNASLKKTVSPEAKNAMKVAGDDRSWWNPGNYWNYSYDDARISFDGIFNKNKAKTSAAMKQYFYAVEGEDLSRKDRRAKVTEIADMINGESRINTIAELEANKGSVPKDMNDDEAIKKAGFTEADITFTMEQTGKTRAEVIRHIRGR